MRGRAGPTLFVCCGSAQPSVSATVIIPLFLGRGFRRCFARLRELSPWVSGSARSARAHSCSARAGLLDGYNCTIHWEHVEGFARGVSRVEDHRNPVRDRPGPLYLLGRHRPPRHDDQTASPATMARNSPSRWRSLLLHNLVRPSPRHPAYARPAPYRHLASQSCSAVIAHMEAYIESPVPLRNLANRCRSLAAPAGALFREKMGKTPSRYYLGTAPAARQGCCSCRPTMPILQIAVACGFTSASHFARCYS